MDMESRGEVLKKGEKIYLATLREDLEKSHLGEYVAIDIESRQHILGPNKLDVVKKAQKSFQQRRFYLVQVGNLTGPSVNSLERTNATWLFAQ